ncbi:ATP-binding protein [Inquilinus sp. Marseille-Q2685]|uniref:sensor histidine kinase n=1 Tax=Inquilinus sp. Marseille-Q2685 TaxID=2866581 RepID=UPI001CE3F992|nr:ATP-binding protein [Inquilinus sp. Marseille-Q2685]
MTGTRRRLGRFTDLPLKTKGIIVVAVPLALLLGALVFAFLADRQSAVAEDRIRLTLAIQSDIQEIHAQIAEAATGVRGYLLTGEDSFLAPYDRAVAGLPVVIERMGGRLVDPEQKERLQRIRTMVAAKLDSRAALRRAATAGPADQPALTVALAESKADLDALRAEIDTMTRREAELLAARSEVAEEARWRSQAQLVAAGVLGLGGALAAVILFSTGIVRRVHALEGAAHRLARGESVAAPHPAGDEIGHLEQALHQASILLRRREAELRESERNLVAAREEALQASRAKSEFLSRMSHELRTPLNSILGFAQLLELDLKDEEARESVAQILRAGRHLLSLVGEVLDLARIEAGGMDLAIEPLAVAELLAEAVTLAAPLGQPRGIALALAAPGGAGLSVLADRRRLLQVLLNLLSNAVKYNRDGGRVVLDHRPADSARVRITIRDTGPGIPPERAERLFAAFERLGADRSAAEGSGLGLALSRQLAEAMGGRLLHENLAEGGSAFHLELPRPRGQLDDGADEARGR